MGGRCGSPLWEPAPRAIAHRVRSYKSPHRAQRALLQQPHWHLLETVDAVGADVHGLTAQLDAPEVAEELLKEDPCFQPGEVGPQAEMDAVTESQVWIRVPADVETQRIVEQSRSSVKQGFETDRHSWPRKIKPV